jgi:Flp pilus assembly protein TadG
VLFFTLILTLFELSRGLMVDYYLANAARQACREGMIPSRTTSDITQAAQDALANCRITGATISVLVNGSPVEASSAQSGDRITVKITIPVSAITIVPLTRYLSGNLSGQYTLRRE